LRHASFLDEGQCHHAYRQDDEGAGGDLAREVGDGQARDAIGLADLNGHRAMPDEAAARPGELPDPPDWRDLLPVRADELAARFIGLPASFLRELVHELLTLTQAASWQCQACGFSLHNKIGFAAGCVPGSAALPASARDARQQVWLALTLGVCPDHAKSSSGMIFDAIQRFRSRTATEPGWKA
jgi:hypothetical protein